MIDKILLFPYWLSLKIRHKLYDSGVKKVHQADVPTISIGNVTVGGTGKTPGIPVRTQLGRLCSNGGTEL